MAIGTTNEKLALMEWGQVWEPGLPISPGALGQDDKQQLLWGYPGILWGELAADDVILRAITLTGRQDARTATGIQPAHDLKGRQPTSTGTGKV